MVPPEYFHEVKCAARRLKAAPAFTVATTAVLALTLGVGTALFTAINSLVLRPMPFEEQAGLVRITWSENRREISGAILPHNVATQLFSGDFQTLQMGGYSRKDLAVSVAGSTQLVSAEVIAGSYFQIVGAGPVLGRLLTHEDSDTSAPVVAVISETLWLTFRNAGTDPFNETILVGGRPATVVGVVAAPFQGVAQRGVATDLWVPSQDRSVSHAFGRLRGRATAQQADAETKARVSLVARYSTYSVGVASGLLPPFPITSYLVGFASFALCAVVVIVAAASVTNLCLARTSSRQAEIAVRLMLGASARDIRRLISLEVFLIVMGAGVLSIGSAMITLRLILDLLVRSDRIVLSLQPDWRILTYVAVSTLIMLVVISRIVSSQVSPIGGLSTVSATAGMGGSTSGTDLARGKLLAVQVGGSTMLLILAVLLIRSASTGLTYPRGFDPTGAFVGWLDHRSHGHDVELARAVERRVVQILRPEAGHASLAVASALPLEGRGVTVRMVADGGTRPLRGNMTAVSPAFFAAFGLQMVNGRDFSEAEVSEAMPLVVLCKSAAQGLWGNGDPIGRTLRLTDLTELKSDPVMYTVIGVVADTVGAARQTDNSRFVFVPITRQNPTRVALIARTRGSSQESLRLLHASVKASGDHLALQNVSTLEDAIQFSRAGRRASGLVLIAMGLLAAGIAMVGVYGLASHSVSHRQREFGVLVALGATNRALFARLASESTQILTRGAVLGVAASAPGVLLLRRYLWDLQAFDWVAAIAVPALFITVGLTASLLPLRTVFRRPTADLLRTT